MKKDLLVHYSFALVYFLLLTLFRKYFNLDYLPFWFGGLVGTILPDLDYLVHAYLLKPNENMSQEVTAMINSKKYKETWNYVVLNRRTMTSLLFHSSFFQLIFLLFTLYIATSSGSLFGRGLVLSFSLHLFIDQLVDYMDTKNINNWFTDFPFNLDERQRVWYLWGMGVVVVFLGFLL